MPVVTSLQTIGVMYGLGHFGRVNWFSSGPLYAQWLLNLDTLSGDYHLIMVELWGLGESPEPESLNRNSIMFHESCKGDVT